MATHRGYIPIAEVQAVYGVSRATVERWRVTTRKWPGDKLTYVRVVDLEQRLAQEPITGRPGGWRKSKDSAGPAPASESPD